MHEPVERLRVEADDVDVAPEQLRNDEVGRSLCINPGSAYNEGVVRGAFIEVSKEHGIQRWQMVEA